MPPDSSPRRVASRVDHSSSTASRSSTVENSLATFTAAFGARSMYMRTSHRVRFTASGQKA